MKTKPYVVDGFLHTTEGDIIQLTLIDLLYLRNGITTISELNDKLKTQDRQSEN